MQRSNGPFHPPQYISLRMKIYAGPDMTRLTIYNQSVKHVTARARGQHVGYPVEAPLNTPADHSRRCRSGDRDATLSCSLQGHPARAADPFTAARVAHAHAAVLAKACICDRNRARARGWRGDGRAHVTRRRRRSRSEPAEGSRRQASLLEAEGGKGDSLHAGGRPSLERQTQEEKGGAHAAATSVVVLGSLLLEVLLDDARTV